MTALLDVQGIHVRFGGNTAVDDFGLQLSAGERVALIGPNGAGKSTVVNVIAGRLKPRAGGISFAGHDISRLNAHQRARRGLVRTYQDLQLFGELTVHENILTAAEASGAGRKERRRLVSDLLAEIGLTEAADMRVSALPYGVRKLTELARALAVKPKLLVLDEPAAGLDGAEKRGFVDVLERSLGLRGTALVLVEHDMPTVEALATHVKVLDAGKLIAEGSFDAISRDPRVIEAYLGR